MTSTDEAASEAASIRITPLSGSQTSSRALCHLLEFDDAKILLDCGINDRREEFTYDDFKQDRIEYLEKLKECEKQLQEIYRQKANRKISLADWLLSLPSSSCPLLPSRLLDFCRISSQNCVWPVQSMRLFHAGLWVN